MPFKEKPMRHHICTLFLLLIASAIIAAPLPKGGWQRIDPDRDCKIVLKDNTVTMELPGGDHDFAPKRKRFNAPLYLREIEGDFMMQVRVCASFRPSAESAVDGERPRVAAGLVLIPFDKNCIRLEYGAYRQEGKQSNGPAFRMRGERIWNMYQDGWELPFKPEIGKENEERLYLRLDRRGQEIFQFLSPDGKDWGVGTVSVTIPDLPLKIKAGLATYSTSTQPFEVRFDQLKLIRGREKSK
jgi:hypothetical protein